MPYFLKHYSPWVSRLIFYDDHSTDQTRNIISLCNKAEIRDWPGRSGIVDDQFTEFANEQWKEARGYADWVIWVDADEFLYHPNICEVLERYLSQGVDVPQVIGYTMISDAFPTTTGQIYDEIKTGFRDGVWDKKAIFRRHIHYNIGRHSIDFGQFNPRSSEQAELKLLHYRCLGMSYLEERHRRNWERVPEDCRQRNFGNNCSPDWKDHHGIEWFRRKLMEPRENVI